MTILKNIPIQRKLMIVIMVISGSVLLLTCASFFTYEILIFRKSTIEKISTLGEIIATNSTAALAFDSPEEATDILAALKAEKHIICACIYTVDGKLFSVYPETFDTKLLPQKPVEKGYDFTYGYLEGFHPIAESDRKLGILYLRYDLGAMYERFRLYGIIMFMVILVSAILTFVLSRILQRSISGPILTLAETAKVISEKKDYSVRVVKQGQDELGDLTEAFNVMLTQIEEQNRSLHEFNQKLEQKVTERTAELKATNKELEAFSYSVSHDLRAPLRALNGFSEMLWQQYSGSLDDNAKRLLTIIKNNALNMGRLIDDLLDFSRTGRQEVSLAKTDLNHMIESVIRETLQNAPGKANLFRVHPVPDAVCDQQLVRQVFINLISNAIKYSSKNPDAVIEIGAKSNLPVPVYYVKDNGAGFDMQYASKLFGVFQRLHSQKEFEGNGVGLALVQRIVAKHGGKVWAEAEVGKGACFYFTLKKSTINEPVTINN